MKDDEGLTRDAFLGGKVQIRQPRIGYRAGADPVLLAAAVPAEPGQSVLELGCGVGVASLCLAARVAGLSLSGVEMQEAYADLARHNAEENDIPFDVTPCDLAALPIGLRTRRFDHVIANPPYFEPAHRSAADDVGREIALAEQTPLQIWIDVAARRLAPKGYLHVIHRAERLPDLLVAVTDRLGSVEVLPLSGRAGRAPQLVILRARKGGRSPFCLHAPLVMHDGAVHERDGEGYAPEIERVLRKGAALDWPGRR
ncbi:tRNA1(Val) (adenine(37)-N6)-methyltransferase [Thalassococcus sp. S3]|uniref:tRNA1(Val) (adenine(37)-N6)-methyltransferase n=1 Tax=Thalassococcus sp. S3 TaxID=2017482 RepID=UPI0010244FBB|nr:methyltransferase [Thalassococcus sp. S3]QBF30410.1 methyltransferase [Thalassococcus sp. S3]